MSDNQDNQQPQQEENGTSNNVDVPEIELIIKVTGAAAAEMRGADFQWLSGPRPSLFQWNASEGGASC